eukprot:m.191724 g.191724  ORF g.191724 m.191724 type:complete len:416 (+) comp14847_c0_seq10:1863-3110(+)
MADAFVELATIATRRLEEEELQSARTDHAMHKHKFRFAGTQLDGSTPARRPSVEHLTFLDTSIGAFQETACAMHQPSATEMVEVDLDNLSEELRPIGASFPSRNDTTSSKGAVKRMPYNPSSAFVPSSRSSAPAHRLVSFPVSPSLLQLSSLSDHVLPAVHATSCPSTSVSLSAFSPYVQSAARSTELEQLAQAAAAITALSHNTTTQPGEQASSTSTTPTTSPSSSGRSTPESTQQAPRPKQSKQRAAQSTSARARASATRVSSVASEVARRLRSSGSTTAPTASAKAAHTIDHDDADHLHSGDASVRRRRRKRMSELSADEQEKVREMNRIAAQKHRQNMKMRKRTISVAVHHADERHKALTAELNELTTERQTLMHVLVDLARTGRLLHTIPLYRRQYAMSHPSEMSGPKEP